jgi:hypothetical protein
MSIIYDNVMAKLYGKNIWDGFEPRGFVPELPSGEVQGWNGYHPSLAALASAPGPKIVVDVGVWKGQSTIHMANAMRYNGVNGVVIAVDTFLGSPEHWGDGAAGGLFERQYGMPNLYQTFLSNVHAAGLTDFVVPMAQTSSTACNILRRLDIRPTIVHIDAAHEYREALQDMEDYWDILAENGYLIGDDYHVSWPGVIQAAGEISSKLRKPLTIEQSKFMLQKA